jgi:MoaA/NifB/PqqE/SkfB family radical SAM enzyme
MEVAKMNPFLAYSRKWQSFEAGVAHATLDPKGPGVARLHLVPPAPSFWRDPPSMLIINGGTAILPIGPSWATVARIFFDELNTKVGIDKEVTPEILEAVESAVVARVRHFYPKTARRQILHDLRQIVSLAVSIARGDPIPAEIQGGMTLKEWGKYATAPQRMDLCVSAMVVDGHRNCQLDCGCCYAANAPAMSVERELSTEEWKEIIDRCQQARVPMLTFTGGEPLRRHDIVELVRYASWFVTRLNTNGVDLTPTLAKALYEASLDGIQITFYSDQETVHDRLVGRKGGWSRTVAGIRAALEAGLQVSVNTPLLRLNRDYARTLRFLHSLGVRCVTCSNLIPAGGANGLRPNDALPKSELLQVLELAMPVIRELGMEIMFTSPGWLTAEEAHNLGLTSHPICGAALSNMAVTPTGEVAPCQSWLNGQTFGNMLRDKWERIWNHPLAKQLRGQDHESVGCPLKGM